MAAQAKKSRSILKGTFTRADKSLFFLIGKNRPENEIRHAFDAYENAYIDLESAHRTYLNQLDDDALENEDAWLNEFSDALDRTKTIVEDYLNSLNQTPPRQTHQGFTNRKLKVKVEKAEKPKFSGEIIDYFEFKNDFKFVYNSDYDLDEQLYILKRSIPKDGQNWIRGVDSIAEAWATLDDVYGDSRVVSDTVLKNISKIKPVPENNLPKLTHLYHEINKSKNILKELGRASDLDNSTTLSTIESKLCHTDRIKWARTQVKHGIIANIDTFLEFLNDEIIVQRLAGSELRSSNSSTIKGHIGVETALDSEDTDIKSQTPSTPMSSNKQQQPDNQPRQQTTYQTPYNGQRTCWICKGDHKPPDCPQYIKLSLADRLRRVRDGKACIYCLNKHFGRCRRRKPCDQLTDGEKCKYSHHVTLHGAPFQTILKTGIQAAALSTGAILPVITAVLSNYSHELTKEDGLIFTDNGAALSLIKDATAKELQLYGSDIMVTLGKIGNVEETYLTKLYVVYVKGLNGGPCHKVKAIGIPEICSDIQYVNLEMISEQFKINLTKLHRGSGSPDLLIGVDHVKFHSGEIIVDNDVAVRNSILGPIIFGVSTDEPNGTGTHSVNLCAEINKLSPVSLDSFMGAEEMGIDINSCCMDQRPGQRLLCPTERQEENIIRKSATKTDNQWLIPIPWCKNPALLGTNYNQALSRLESVEKRLRNNPELSNMYHEQIMDLKKRHCAKILTKQELDNYSGPIFYITHHAVLRPEKVSTPCRLVFNSALNFKGQNLNDFQYKGPDLLNSLVGVIIRFRENLVGVVGDLAKMFQQIRFSPDIDANTHRFLWRNMENRPPDIYAMQVLIFGDKCSPAIANTAVNLTAEEYLDQYPQSATDILICRYMDDLCNSYENPIIAKQRITETDYILSKGHFSVKQWVSNVDLGTDKQIDSKVKIIGAQNEKVLGISWDRESDVLRICSKIPKMFQGKYESDWTIPLILSKRMTFSVCAGIFDMIGFTAPFVIRGKIGMQELWAAKYDWDQDLPSDVKEFWFQWFQELKEIDTVCFERCLTPMDVIGPPILVIFADASSQAYGAVAYFRWKLKTEHYAIRFVMAKSRVAPMRNIGIPRLELNSLVVASRLNYTIIKESRLKIKETVIFSDSRIALAWIKSDSRHFKPYVSVRVGEIQTKAECAKFRFVPSALNIADDVSRGLSINQLQGRWAHGEDFLFQSKDNWPEDTSNPDETEKSVISAEKVRKSLVAVAADDTPYHETYIRRFSSLRRAITVTAIRQRVIYNFKASIQNLPRIHGDITIEEHRAAEKLLIIDAQKLLLPLLDKGTLKSLSPTIDENGIYVVRGRTANLVSYENYSPPILPKTSWLAVLIVRHIHQNCGHPGVAACAAKVRRKYWIISVTKLAKTVKYKCVFCREWDAKTETQIMADLPSVRLKPQSPPWYFTAVDLFGPIKVTVGRKTTDKAYGVLFTCLNVRAVHIDISKDYSTMEFLQVLRRFFSLRGQVHTLFSDRGSQLVGADTELQNAVKGWDKNQLKDFCHSRQTKWEFFTPTAAHQNGCAESMIKTTKLAIKRAIGNQIVSPLELQTVFFEIANLINDRPIGRIPNDPDDGHYLSPNDLLLGRASSSIPQGPFLETKNPRHRYEFCQKIVENWWQRWYRDIFPSLLLRKKWHTSNRNLQIGDYVIMKDNNPIRGKWSKGLITSVFPGTDGHIRNVKVKTDSGEYERPISKIVLIYPVEGYGDDE